MFISYKQIKSPITSTGGRIQESLPFKYELIHCCFRTILTLGDWEYVWGLLLVEYRDRKFSSDYIGESLARAALARAAPMIHIYDNLDWICSNQDFSIRDVFFRDKEIIEARNKHLSRYKILL